MPDGMIIPRKEDCIDAVRVMALDAARNFAADPLTQKSSAKRLLLKAYAEIDGDDLLDDLVAKITAAQQIPVAHWDDQAAAYEDCAIAAEALSEAYATAQEDAEYRDRESRVGLGL